MALPKIETPKYFLTVPSTQETVEYRPFLVKEEKILMIAQEAGTQTSMIAALKELLKACTFGALDLYKLPMSDLEYILLQIRAKSAGETAKFKLKCTECEEHESIELDLSTIEVQSDGEEVSNVIQLTETVGVTLKAPNLKDVEKVARNSKKTNELTQNLSSLIENVFDENEVYPFDQATPKEIEDFIESLNSEQITKINDWVSSIPSLRHDIEFTCPNKHKNKHTLSGLADFFS